MQMYNYRCGDCDEVFQVERPLGHASTEKCPSCGGTAWRVFKVFENPPKLGGGACSDDGCFDLVDETRGAIGD